MIVPILLLGAASLLVSRSARQRVSSQPMGRPADEPIGRSADQLYRVTATVPLGYVESVRGPRGQDGQRALLDDVRARVGQLGFPNAILVSQDPTDNRVVRLIARRAGTPRSTDGLVQIGKVEAVDDAPSVDAKPDSRATGLDPGMTADEVEAVRYALAREHHPGHLWGFATTLEPSFPVAATLLQSRRRRLEEGSAAPSSPLSAERGKPDAESLARLERLREQALEYGREHAIPPEIVREEIRRCVYLLASEQSGEAAPAFVAAAEACVLGFGLVDREALAVVCPFVAKDVFVSPAAVHLTLARMKPEISGVSDAPRGRRIQKSLDQEPTAAERPQRLRARSAMAKAQKAIERRRWVEWYKRSRRMGS